MKKIFKYLFVLICSIFIFSSCSNNNGFDLDEVFITLNIYNNVDDDVSQITYTRTLEGYNNYEITLDRFGYDTSKEGYIYFGGYSEKNGKGEQYVNLNNFINVDSNQYYQYFNYDIYLHYEKYDEDNIVEITYNLPDDYYIDGELPTQFVRGESYTLPTVYQDEHFFNGWSYKAVYDEFVSQDFSFGGENTFRWYGKYSHIELTPSLSSYSNRYYIDSPQDLVNIKNHPSGEIIFVNDIDMTGVNYTPFAFSGTIKGNDHIISNLSITTTSTNAGLFTTNSGKIEDLVLRNITINSLNEETSYIGALAGTSSGTIIDVVASGTINSEKGVVGGIVGKMTGKELCACNTNLTINSGNDGSSYVGGIVGRMEGGKIYFCSSSSTINAPSTTVGGLVGSLVNSTMEDCYNYGSVTATGSEVGGLIGKTDGVKMLRCQNKGVVTGCNSVGGLVGILDNSSVNELTNLGEVNGYDNVGGIIGTFTSTQYAERKLDTLKNEGKVISVGSNVGGIIGNIDFDGSSFVINDLLNKASVEAKGNQVGGIIGRIKGFIGFSSDDVWFNKITNCTNEGSVTGNSNVGGFNGYMHLNAENQWGRHPGIKIEMDSINNSGNILGENYVGGLIGNGSGQDGKGSIIKNSTSSSKVEGGHTVGGIAGYLNFITVDTCSNVNSVINATGSYSDDYGTYVRLGGYCGVGSEIKNVTNEVDISYQGEGKYIGGIVGLTNGNLSSCINKGNITANNSSLVAGIAGYIKTDRDFKAYDLYNEGNITGKDSVGGVIGNLYVELIAYKDNDTHLTTLDKIVNKGNITVGGSFGGVIASVYGNATNEYLRFPTVKITITNIENYGDIEATYESRTAIGALIGYMETDSEDSYVKNYIVSTKVNSALANEENVIGYNMNITVGEGEVIIK